MLNDQHANIPTNTISKPRIGSQPLDYVFSDEARIASYEYRLANPASDSTYYNKYPIGHVAFPYLNNNDRSSIKGEHNTLELNRHYTNLWMHSQRLIIRDDTEYVDTRTHQGGFKAFYHPYHFQRCYNDYIVDTTIRYNLHEIIHADRKQKVKFDIDGADVRLKDIIVDLIREVLFGHYAILIDINCDIIHLDSSGVKQLDDGSTGYKHSWHIVFPYLIVENCYEMKHLREQLQQLIIERSARQLNITEAEHERLKGIKVIDATDHVSQSFRMPYSWKEGRQCRFSSDNATSSGQLWRFVDGLITYVDENCAYYLMKRNATDNHNCYLSHYVRPNGTKPHTKRGYDASQLGNDGIEAYYKSVIKPRVDEHFGKDVYQLAGVNQYGLQMTLVNAAVDMIRACYICDRKHESEGIAFRLHKSKQTGFLYITYHCWRAKDDPMLRNSYLFWRESSSALNNTLNNCTKDSNQGNAMSRKITKKTSSKNTTDNDDSEAEFYSEDESQEPTNDSSRESSSTSVSCSQTSKVKPRPYYIDEGDLSRPIKTNQDFMFKYSDRIFNIPRNELYKRMVADLNKITVVLNGRPPRTITTVDNSYKMEIEMLASTKASVADECCYAGDEVIRFKDVFRRLARDHGYLSVDYYPCNRDRPQGAHNYWKEWDIVVPDEFDDGSLCLDESLYADCKWMRDHIFNIACKKNKKLYLWFISYIGGIFSGVKPGAFALFYSESKGAGKNIITDYLRKMMGLMYCVELQWKDITCKFNNLLMHRSLVIVNELPKAADGLVHKSECDSLKQLVTRTIGTYECKGTNSFQMNDYTAYIFTTNHLGSIRFEDKDRRGTVFEFSNEYAYDPDDEKDEHSDRKQMKDDYFEEGERHIKGDLQPASMKSFLLYAKRTYRYYVITTKQIKISKCLDTEIKQEAIKDYGIGCTTRWFVDHKKWEYDVITMDELFNEYRRITGYPKGKPAVMRELLKTYGYYTRCTKADLPSHFKDERADKYIKINDRWVYEKTDGGDKQ